MVVERRIGCEMIGLSSDVKPDYPGIIDYRFYEIDTGYIYYYTGAAWGVVSGAAAPEIYAGKTVSNMDNSFSDAIAVDLPTSFGYKRSGSFIPAVNGPWLAGAFGGMNVTVGASENPINGLDSGEGNYQNFKGNLTGEKLGINSTSSTNSLITTRGQQPYVSVRCKIDSTTGVRLWFGFTSNQTLPASNTVLGTTDSGVIIGFGSATANITAYNNDGAGGAAALSNFGSGVVKDNSWHTYEIAMTTTTITCSLDGQEILLSDQLPNASTNLYFNCLVQYV